MSFTLSGSGAGSVEVHAMTENEVYEEYGGDLDVYTDDQRVIVLVDTGNQLAYVIEGDYAALTDLYHRLGNAIALVRKAELDKETPDA